LNAGSFWAPFETVISSFPDLVKEIDRVMLKAANSNIQFAWRGQVKSDWPLHSSLYRRMVLTYGGGVDEQALADKEQEILVRLHRWGLHASSESGRLSVLKQLAMLQHYGAPTRLIDISYNAWVGAWFAVEQKWDNGQEIYMNDDARLFAFDVTDRLINEQDDFRDWEDDTHRPWGLHSVHPIDPRAWTTSVFAWRPPRLDGRISAQNGGFLFGGVVSSSGPNGKTFQFPTGSRKNVNWPLEEGRQACCLALRPNKFSARKGLPKNGALYTFRIEAKAKVEIRERLERMFGYRHSAIYPDYTGFSLFGTSELKKR